MLMESSRMLGAAIATPTSRPLGEYEYSQYCVTPGAIVVRPPMLLCRAIGRSFACQEETRYSARPAPTVNGDPIIVSCVPRPAAAASMRPQRPVPPLVDELPAARRARTIHPTDGPRRNSPRIDDPIVALAAICFPDEEEAAGGISRRTQAPGRRRQGAAHAGYRRARAQCAGDGCGLPVGVSIFRDAGATAQRPAAARERRVSPRQEHRVQGPEAHRFPGRLAASKSARCRSLRPVSYTHLRAHETVLDLVCRL